ncbi:ABC transporter substrate-binding protein [Rhodobium gokarnense]|uniref:Peptide/nickel transport system substrate-binding protein n=1 Tax=Rhodobium gokarnense TaxID=364296 RepID=A0ABT3HET4_9HYPH|nr:ABC transporter substrate-binding protein [Rhodobium gokarnense]MCW2308885.1 peptide/nickel transport system substrate-binding protein [Rhodobium gokarnense]
MRRLITCLGAALSALLLLSANAMAAKDGGTLIMLVKPEPPTLASYLSTSGPIGQVSTKVYEGLLEYDFDLNPQPGLAKSWEISDDGKTMTFKLQEGVTFHDGTPFTSADVEYSINEVLRKVHPRAALTFKELESIETPDDLTVVFHLKNAAPYLIRALSGYESPIVSKKLFEGTDPRDNPTANKPVGTGPFMFVEWQKGQYIRLDKNPNYWKEGLPHLDRLVARFIPDAGTRTAALEKGEVQFAAFNAIPNVDAKRLDDMDGISVTTEGYTMINPLMLLEVNTKSPPLDNRAVRQAISYAIDRQFIIDNIFFGFGKPATGSILSSFGSVGLYSSDVRDYAVADRIDIANKLLDDAGFKRDADGVRFEIVHDILPYGESWRRLGEYLKQALGEVGIKVTLRYEDVPTWLKRIYTNYDYQLNSTFFYQLADPVLGMHRQYLTSQIRKGTVFVNGAQYSNPTVDELMDKASTEPDSEARGKLYAEIQKILAEDVPVIPLFEMDFITVQRDFVKDAIVSPLGVYASFDRAWLDK